MNIGITIKELRKQRNLSQRELAQAAGLTQTSLSQIESGSKKPNSATIKKLSDFFEVGEPVFYLLGIEKSDVSSDKLGVYEELFPSIREILLKMFSYSNK